MNPDHPFPDEPNGAMPAELVSLEQQLKRLRPHPPALNAETLIHAARQQAIAPAAERHERRPNRRRNWGSLAAAWGSGALAGALMTFCLLRNVANVPTAVPAVDDAPSLAAAPALPPSARAEDTPAGTPAAEAATVPWSRAELLLSAQLAEFSRGPTPVQGQLPVQVSSYARLSATMSPRSSGPASAAQRPPAAGNALPGDRIPSPDPPLDRNQLLEELLGMQPGSLL